MRFGVTKAVAALMLAQQLHLPAMAQGGHAKKHQPVVVGERGPEVFVPDVPGTIEPGPNERRYPE